MNWFVRIVTAVVQSKLLFLAIIKSMLEALVVTDGSGRAKGWTNRANCIADVVKRSKGTEGGGAENGIGGCDVTGAVGGGLPKGDRMLGNWEGVPDDIIADGGAPTGGRTMPDAGGNRGPLCIGPDPSMGGPLLLAVGMLDGGAIEPDANGEAIKGPC
nr:hypothetical protein Iba_chr12cCG14270 [Ipomoea batatas]GMD68566.1 hypothetical protein Iba_chr12dCG10410 [Ipomoea batatas]